MRSGAVDLLGGVRRNACRRAPKFIGALRQRYESASVAALDEPDHHAAVRTNAVDSDQLTRGLGVGIAVVGVADTVRECRAEKSAAMKVAMREVVVTMKMSTAMKMATEADTAAMDTPGSMVHSAHPGSSHVASDPRAAHVASDPGAAHVATHLRTTARDSGPTAAVPALRICRG
jgi:hypothetical protein